MRCTGFTLGVTLSDHSGQTLRVYGWMASMFRFDVVYTTEYPCNKSNVICQGNYEAGGNHLTAIRLQNALGMWRRENMWKLHVTDRHIMFSAGAGHHRHVCYA